MKEHISVNYITLFIYNMYRTLDGGTKYVDIP
jgi:hypothetical protein